MLILPPLTALFLTLQPSGFLNPWLPSALTPDIMVALPMAGVRPSDRIRRPDKAPMLRFRLKAGLQPDTAPTPHPVFVLPPESPPLPSFPATKPLPATATSSSSSSRSSRRSTDSLNLSPASTTGNATLSWNIFHPWLGLIYIHSPGFISQPGRVVDFPYFSSILPQPVTLAEPDFQPDGGYLMALPYQPGYVAWITRF